jgi:CBS domain containing-hemolysin-like protein
VTVEDTTMLSDILPLPILIMLNGVFALSEIAIVSSRRARLVQMAETGVRARGERWPWRRNRLGSCRPCRWASPASGF